MKKGTILVTGGAGYIGSHTVVALVEAGYTPVVVDNFSNSKPEALMRVGKIVGQEIEYHAHDLREVRRLDALFKQHKFDGVIHFAGLKAVGESVQKPLEYYSNNIGSTLALLRIMNAYECRNLVFSSSATVYGDPQTLPIDEDSPLSATNPYGRSKLMIEDMLRDIAVANLKSQISDLKSQISNLKSPTAFHCLLLRYFNPVGAHPSGTIGEDPNGIPNNLFPYISQVAVGKLPSLKVYGNDYPTPDGTGVRDYIHVVDLAEGHVKALDFLLGNHPVAAGLARGPSNVATVAKTVDSGSAASSCIAINLGTGIGYSVLEAIKAFEHASGKTITYTIAPRRPGDIASCYANPNKAKTLLGWQARYDLAAMCRDAWKWQSNNPRGYE